MLPAEYAYAGTQKGLKRVTPLFSVCFTLVSSLAFDTFMVSFRYLLAA